MQAKLVIDPKKWLGDNKVLKMDWTARAMHFHLMLIAWQNTPQGHLEADERTIAKYLSLDVNGEEWKKYWPQISSAWQLTTALDESNTSRQYYVQTGLIKEIEKQLKPKKPRVKVSEKINPLVTINNPQGLDNKNNSSKYNDGFSTGFNLLDVLDESINQNSNVDNSIEETNKSEETSFNSVNINNGPSNSQTMWTLGIQLLSNDNYSQSSARGFLAKLAKQYGEVNLAAAISQVALKKINPIEVKSYLVAILKNKVNPSANNGQKVLHNQASGKLIL